MLQAPPYILCGGFWNGRSMRCSPGSFTIMDPLMQVIHNEFPGSFDEAYSMHDFLNKQVIQWRGFQWYESPLDGTRWINRSKLNYERMSWWHPSEAERKTKEYMLKPRWDQVYIIHLWIGWTPKMIRKDLTQQGGDRTCQGGRTTRGAVMMRLSVGRLLSFWSWTRRSMRDTCEQYI